MLTDQLSSLAIARAAALPARIALPPRRRSWKPSHKAAVAFTNSPLEATAIGGAREPSGDQQQSQSPVAFAQAGTPTSSAPAKEACAASQINWELMWIRERPP